MTAPTYLGEIGVLERIPRTATVTARGPVKVLRIDGDRLLDALTASPASSSLMEKARGRLTVTHFRRTASVWSEAGNEAETTSRLTPDALDFPFFPIRPQDGGDARSGTRHCRSYLGTDCSLAIARAEHLPDIPLPTRRAAACCSLKVSAPSGLSAHKRSLDPEVARNAREQPVERTTALGCL